MKKLVIFATLIASLTLMGLSVNAQNWAGKYEYGEDGGKTPSDIVIYVSHQLEISESGAVTIKSAGFQTSIDLVATAKEENGKLNIYFESYGDENSMREYNVGDLLFTLEKRKVKGGTRLLTTWGKFEPAFGIRTKTGAFFKKAI